MQFNKNLYRAKYYIVTVFQKNTISIFVGDLSSESSVGAISHRIALAYKKALPGLAWKLVIGRQNFLNTNEKGITQIMPRQIKVICYWGTPLVLGISCSGVLLLGYS